MNDRKEFTLANLLKIYRTNSRFIIIFVLSGILLVSIYAFISPKIFTTKTTIIPPEDNGGGGLSDFIQNMAGIKLGGAQTNKALIMTEFLKSREVAKKIADTLDLYNHPYFKGAEKENIYFIVSNMILVNQKKTGIIEVTASAATPYFSGKNDETLAAKLAADIANASVISLDKLNREKSVSKARNKRIFIERMLSQKRVELDKLDSVLEKFRKSNKVLALDAQTTSILSNAVSIGSELEKTELEISLKSQEYEPQSPVMKALREKSNTLRQQYARSQAGGVNSSDNYSIPLTNVPFLMKEYTNLIRDQKILEQVNIYLETQKYQEAIQEESDMPTIEQLDRAQVPIHRASPDRKVMIILGFLVSTFFALSYVTVSAFIKGYIYLKREEAPVSELI